MDEGDFIMMLHSGQLNNVDAEDAVRFANNISKIKDRSINKKFLNPNGIQRKFRDVFNNNLDKCSYKSYKAAKNLMGNIENIFDGQEFHESSPSKSKKKLFYSNAELDLSSSQLNTNLNNTLGREVKLNRTFGECLFNIGTTSISKSISAYIDIIDMLHMNYGWNKYVVVIPNNQSTWALKKLYRQKHNITHADTANVILDTLNGRNYRDYQDYGRWEYVDADWTNFSNSVSKFYHSKDLQILVLNYEKLIFNAKNEDNNMGRLRIYSQPVEGKNSLDMIGKCRPIVIWDAQDNPKMNKVDLQFDMFNSLFGFSFTMSNLNPTIGKI